MNLKRILFCLIFCFCSLEGTPSSVFWTVSTTDVQPTGVLHFGVDNYFTVFNRRGHGQNLLIDVGLTYGIFDWNNLKAEVGIDYLGGADDPLFFNGKIGFEENLFCEESPALSLGIFGIGTRHREARTDFNIIDVVVGKTIKSLDMRVFLGGYRGNRSMGPVRAGFTIAFEKKFGKTKTDDGKEEYYKWIIVGDYATGKNVYGGGGVGICYYFTPNISILTGPTFFNDASFNGRWKWALQIDIDIPIVKSN